MWAADSPAISVVAGDVAVVAVAAGGAVAAVGEEVVGTPALARAAVVVGATPRIGRDVLLEVRAVPAVGAEGSLAERREPLLAGRVAADVEAEGVERCAEHLDLGARRLQLRLLALLDEVGADQRHQEPDDDHHDHHLDEREARLPFPRSHGCTPHIGRSLTLKIADSMEITMDPTPRPITRMSTGSSRRVNCWIWTRTSRSKWSATRIKSSSSLPVSSPTAIICTASGGKTPERASGSATPAPSRTPTSTSPSERAITWLPATSFTMPSACSMGTPLLSSVPRVRARLATSILRRSCPTSTRRSFHWSHS